MEENYELAFEIILHAGNSKNNAMLAMKAARNYDFNQAETFMKEAEKESILSHEIQTKLIQNEADGNKISVDLIMVHAQDHLCCAMQMMETASEIIHIYKQLSLLTKKGD